MSADAEKAVSSYLRDHADIMALGTRVVGKPPSDTAGSWIQVTLINEAPLDLGDYAQEVYVQFDCYAGAEGGQPEANRLAMAVKSVLNQLRNSSESGGLLGSARASRGPRDVDPDIKRDRCIVTSYVWLHG